MFELSRQSARPLADQLFETVIEAIRAGRLPEGSRLPSVRALARRSRVSAHTVSRAFERLVAHGVVVARPGSGYFVARTRRPRGVEAIELAPLPHADPVLDLAQRALDGKSCTVAAGSGFLPPAWLQDAFPPSVFARALRGGSVQRAAPVAGDEALRELLAERLVATQVPARSAQILTTFGATHAFDLIARALLPAGSAVLVEDPGYFVLPAQLRALGLAVHGVPRASTGIDLDALEQAAQALRPSALFTQTIAHNPTGASSTPANLHGLLKIAEKHELLVVEDHVFADLASPNAPSLAQLDGLERVAYVGSFGKVLGPGVRSGFVAARRPWIDRLRDAKLLGVLSGSRVEEVALRELLAGGHYRRHVERLRRRLARARAGCLADLQACGLELVPGDTDGIFAWARLPDRVDQVRLSAAAREAGILLAPGALFSPSGSYHEWLRINVGYAGEPALREFLAQRCREPAVGRAPRTSVK